MLQKFLNKYATSSRPEDFDGFSQIIDFIDSLEAIEVLCTYCLEHLKETQAEYLVKQNVFQLFNAGFALTVGDSLSFKLAEPFITFVDLLSKYTPSRELYLVAVERLLGGCTISSLPFVLYTLQCALLGSNSIDMFNSGLTLVINRSCQICTEATTAIEEEDGPPDVDSDKEDDNMLQDAAPTATQLKVTATVECVVTILISFARGVTLKRLHWCTEECASSAILTSVQNTSPERRGVLVGFLLGVLSRLALLIDTSDELRRHHTTILTGLLLLVVEHQPLVLLNHLRREKYHQYRTKRSGIVQRMLSGKTVAADLTPQSDYEQQIAGFVSSQLKSGDGLCTSEWEHVIPNENVVDDYRAIWSSGSGSGEKYQAISYTHTLPTGPDEMEECVTPRISTSLQWSITGLAMMAGYLLNHCITTSTSTGEAVVFPRVYSPSFLKSCLEDYGNILTRHSNLAVCEGLLYAKSLGLLLDSIELNTSALPLKLFLSVDTATTKGDHLLNRLIQHSYSAGSISGAQCEIATALLIADSTDTLTVCNNIIIAMASCHDSQRCSDAMTGLRSILRQFEPHSLMCLLLRLIDQSPFVFISGLLIDIVKECAQAASLGLRWGQMRTPVSVVHAPINNSCDITTAGALTSAWEGKHILSKVFRGVDEVLTHCQDANGHALWSQFRDSNLLELPLRNYSLTAPSTDGEGGDSAPSVNTELCGAIYSFPATIATGAGSPFWSPLLSRSILPHLQHILKWTTVEKCLENLDVTAAVVNLIQFISMRLSSGLEFIGEVPRLKMDAGANSVVSYWLHLLAAKDAESLFVSSVQDLVQMLKGMKLVQELIGGHILTSMNEKVKGRNNLQLTKVQLLCSNIDHSVVLLKNCCTALCWLMK